MKASALAHDPLEPADAHLDESPRHHDRVSEPPELLKTGEAAALMRFDGPTAIKDFWGWADRYNVPRLHRGRTLLWERRVLRDYLERKPWTRRRV